MMTTPTPRTDALLLEVNEGRVYETNGPIADFARTLEREIERLTSELKEARKLHPERGDS